MQSEFTIPQPSFLSVLVTRFSSASNFCNFPCSRNLLCNFVSILQRSGGGGGGVNTQYLLGQVRRSSAPHSTDQLQPHHQQQPTNITSKCSNNKPSFFLNNNQQTYLGLFCNSKYQYQILKIFISMLKNYSQYSF